MTDAGWADETVAAAQRRYPNANMLNIAAYVATKEHKRAVRVVKREIVATEKLRDTALRVDNVAAEAVYLDTIVALNKALAALQKGRT